MKKGDKVVIRDGSFTKSVVGGKLVGEYLANGDEKNKQYVVIETGCSFPNSGSRGHCLTGTPPTFNNTVIQAIDSGKVVFIEERFLELVALPKHTVFVDVESNGCTMFGAMYKISDELYKKIKCEA